ncbi:MAG: hypothetical protein K6T57_15705 [Thermaceae bacterium]|nr:hypothetical protein [Thermaceae bacterium]
MFSDRATLEIPKHCPSLRPYSGRGMYGQQCPALAVDDVPSGIQELFESAREHLSADQALDGLQGLVADFRTDALGFRTVMYWPQMDWSDLEPQEEEAA